MKKLFLSFLIFLTMYGAKGQLAFRKPVTTIPLDIHMPQVKIYTRSYGMIIGIQRGKYTFLELGAEKHWKKVKLVKPRTFALGANMEYNFGNNVLGYKISGWSKIGRVNLTYGFNLCYFTNFESSRYGIAPSIGFRFLGFHLINGYNFTIGDSGFQEFNKLYISIRYFFPLDRKIQFKKKK